jgi:hypothetical protein
MKYRNSLQHFQYFYKDDEQCSLLTLPLQLTIPISDDSAPVHRGNQIPPEGKTTYEMIFLDEGKTTYEMIFLDPVGMDGVWMMESSYTGTIRQTTIKDGTLRPNPTVQTRPYVQGNGSPPTAVGSPQGHRFCARSTL